MLAVYGSWLGIKALQYSSNDYYPVGIEGIPMYVKDFGIFELLSPQLFEPYSEARLVSSGIPVVKRAVFNIGYMFNMAPFSIPDGLNFTTMKYLLFPRHIAYMAAIYIPLALLAIFGLYMMIKDSIKAKEMHDNVNLYIMGLFVIFIFPLLIFDLRHNFLNFGKFGNVGTNLKVKSKYFGFRRAGQENVVFFGIFGRTKG